MVKRFLIVFFGFLAGVAGNLLAGWIQQGIWSNFFTLERIIGTIIGAGVIFSIISWLESRERPLFRPPVIVQSSNSGRFIPTHINLKVHNRQEYDAFISYAGEDSSTFVNHLALHLMERGYRIWYKEFNLKVGDSLRQTIDKGLTNSKFGIVVLSQAFFQKKWPQYELDGLLARETQSDKVILPVWYGISRDDILAYSPTLADKVAVETNNKSIEQIADALSKVLQT